MLLEARQQIVELSLESGAGTILVELVQEGILGVFQDLDAFKPARQHVDQRRLADADRAVDRQLVEG